MKIFRHTATPPVAAVSIYTATDELFKPATLATLDSGSGMFQKISGTWYLNGLATSVTTTDSSTFGTDITTAPSPQPPAPSPPGPGLSAIRTTSCA